MKLAFYEISVLYEISVQNNEFIRYLSAGSHTTYENHLASFVIETCQVIAKHS